jgi:hypothetical protein
MQVQPYPALDAKITRRPQHLLLGIKTLFVELLENETLYVSKVKLAYQGSTENVVYHPLNN